ncbi:MAG: hypothetical protein ACLFR1_09385 [Spirochaetia bacterium]
MEKRIIIAVVLFLLFGVSLVFASQVYVHNNEPAVFYYRIDPINPAALNAQVSYDSIITEFQNNPSQIESLTPGGLATIGDLTEGVHLLAGFFVYGNEQEYHLVVRSFAVGAETIQVRVSGDDKVQLSSGNTLGFSSEFFADQRTGIIIDNSFSDWEYIPPKIQWAQAYQPRRIYRISNNTRSRTNLSESLFWEIGGTNLRIIKIWPTEEYLYFHIVSRSRFEDGVSYYFRVFPETTEGEQNQFTLEVPISVPGNIIALWTIDGSNPEAVGNFCHTSFLLEGRISLSQLPGALRNVLLNQSADIQLYSIFQDAGVQEEYYLGNIPAAGRME